MLIATSTHRFKNQIVFFSEFCVRKGEERKNTLTFDLTHVNFIDTVVFYANDQEGRVEYTSIRSRIKPQPRFR